MSMLEVVKPAAPGRIQVRDNFRQTIPGRPLGPYPNAIPNGLEPLPPNPASPRLEAITQKLKALSFLPTIPYVGLLGIKTQAVCLYPGLHLGQRRWCLLSTAAQHYKVVGGAHHPVALLLP